MNQIAIFIFFSIIGSGFGGSDFHHFGSHDQDDLDEKLENISLRASKTDEPVINPHDGYIFEFMARGFDVTSQTLFGDLSLGALKKRIFKYNSSIHDEAKRRTSPDGLVVYYVPEFVKKFENDSDGMWNLTTIFKLESDLNYLLDATEAAFEPRGYASQVFESSYYGRVSAESICFIDCWKVFLIDFSSYTLSNYLEEDFMNSVKKLPEEYNKSTAEVFTKFIHDYGTHFLDEVNFGGKLLMESKANDRFVEDVSSSSYYYYLQESIERLFDFEDQNAARFNETIPREFYYHNHNYYFTYGGNESDIKTRGDVKQWIKTIEFNPVALDGFCKDISDLIEILQPGTNKAAAFDKAVEIALKKYKISEYLGALEVVNANLYGHAMAGHFNPVKLIDYFSLLLNETDPNFNSTYEDNCWCAHHCVESILNRRNWFPKPLPVKTTKAPTSIATTFTTPSTTSTTQKHHQLIQKHHQLTQKHHRPLQIHQRHPPLQKHHQTFHKHQPPQPLPKQVQLNLSKSIHL